MEKNKSGKSSKKDSKSKSPSSKKSKSDKDGAKIIKSNSSSTKKSDKVSAKSSSKGSSIGISSKKGRKATSSTDLDETDSKAVNDQESLEDAPPLPLKLLLGKYFCCFCFLSNNRRRRRKKPPTPPVEALPETTPAPDKPSKKVIREKAALKMQSVARGFLGRLEAEWQWLEVLAEANEHWLDVHRQRELARLRKQQRIAARKAVSSVTISYNAPFTWHRSLVELLAST